MQEAKNHASNCLTDGSTEKEYLAARVYALFENRTKASKTISAQYLAGALENKQLTPDAWREVLPPYLVEAIDYVTGKVDPTSDAAV